MTEQFLLWMKSVQSHIDLVLEDYLPKEENAPAVLCQAMRYATLDGGKRIRPLLVFATGYMYEVEQQLLEKSACAVEMMHAYSLIHDDMPCMDNDVLRRGKPTVHVKYGQAMALLAGDALQAQSLITLSQAAGNIQCSVKRMQILSQASGACGMCGGQAIDLLSVGKILNREQLEQMHRLKTGALLRASVLLGAYCAQEEPTKKEISALETYAQAIGLAYQVVDDILDVSIDSTQLGKTAGKDALENKPTYVSLLGVDASSLYAQQLRLQAHEALSEFGAKAIYLKALADLIVNRKN